nr:exodeoxyribonuclease VII large subunit [Solirubrobacterales bacterium]
RLETRIRTIERRAKRITTGQAERLSRLEQAARAHDPERTLERGYALVEDEAGRPLTSAAAARRHERLAVRFADDAVAVRTDEDKPSGGG